MANFAPTRAVADIAQDDYDFELANIEREIEALAHRRHELAARRHNTSAAPRADVIAVFVETKRQNSLEVQRADLPTQQARAFLCSSQPQHHGQHEYLLWKETFGDAHERLCDVILKDAYHHDPQARKFVAIVQAYGTGKTRTALLCSRSFITLAWRVSSGSSLLKEVVKEQKTRRQALKPNPSFNEVERFSEQCVALLRLALLAHLELFLAVTTGGTNSFNPTSADDRMTFACLQLLNPIFQEWMVRWFRENKTMTREQCDMRQEEILKRFPEGLRRVVYVIDEPQQTFGECRGFCLHDTPSWGDQVDRLALWHKEQKDGGPRSTDLFYQFRIIIREVLLRGSKTGLSFVMCSTELQTWKALDLDRSPLSRHVIRKFSDVHVFTDYDVRVALQRQFNIPHGWVSDKDIASVFPSHFHRPYFCVELLKLMHERLGQLPEDLQQRRLWFISCVKDCADENLHFAQDKLSVLQFTNHSKNSVTSSGLLSLMFVILRLSGGLFDVNEGSTDGEYFLEQVMTLGVIRLINASNEIRIADAVHAEALRMLMRGFEHWSPSSDEVLRSLATNEVIHKRQVGQDNSSKGFVVERALAWLVLKRTIDGIDSTATSAATLTELGDPRVADDVDYFLHEAEHGLHVVFPDTLAGPDLFFRGAEPTTFYAVQCKVVDKVYSFSDLTKALQSVSPSTMFQAGSAVLKDKWGHYRFEFPNIVRVVFAALGFTTQAQYCVREYNRIYPQRRIVLLSLSSIGDQLGPVANAIRQHLSQHPALLLSPNVCHHSTSGELLGKSAQVSMTKVLLKEQCDIRGLPVTGTSQQLRESLNSFPNTLERWYTMY